MDACGACLNLLFGLLQVEKERPWRRFDQDKEAIALHRRLPMVDGLSEEATHAFRLDIELGRLEFLVHPNMAQEDLLVSAAIHGSRALLCCGD